MNLNKFVDIMIEDNLYIFDKRNRNILFKLESTAKDYYKCIKEGKNKNDIIRYMVAKYDADPNVIEKDYVLLHDYIESMNNLEKNYLDNSISSKMYMDELNKIQNYYKKNNKVFRVFLEITYSCNLKCKHCYIKEEIYGCQNENVYMSFERAKNIIDDLENIGVVHVLITGGEPLINPDFYDIVEYASSKNFLLTILTNGTMLKEEDILSKLKNCDIFDIRLSLYGDKINHDSFTGITGSFNKTINTIKQLNGNLNIGTGVYVVNNKNYEDFEYIIDLFDKNNWDLSINTMITPTVEGNMDPTNYRITEKQFLNIIHQKKVSTNGSSCSAGSSRIRITPRGDLIPCEMFPIKFGNVFEKNLLNILESQNRKYFLKMFNDILENHSCSKCLDLKNCKFCPGLFLIENGSFNKKSNYLCNQTKIKASHYD